MFEISETNSWFLIKMSATLENIDVADDFMASFLERPDVPVKVDVFATRILLRESLLNAVTHGSSTDSSEVVHFEVKLDPEGATMIITDFGEGFDWKLQKEYSDTLAEGGRGLALMEIYADSMEYDETGNVLTLKKASKVKNSISR